MSLNILFVHETEYMEKVVYEYQIVPEILASRGHHVFVIDYPTQWKKKNFFDFGGVKTQYLLNVKKSHKKKGITLIRPGIIKIPVFSRFLSMIEYFFIIPRVIKKYKIEKIVLFSVPTNGLQTVYWAKKFKIPVYFRLFDVLHQLVPEKFLKAPTYFLEKKVYSRVQEMATVTPRLTKYALKMGAPNGKTTYMPSGSDADLFFPSGKDAKLMKKYGLNKDDKIILFAGTLYNFSGLDKIIEIMPRYLKKYPKLKLIIAGDGEQYETLVRQIKELNLEKNVILTGFIQYEKLPKIINLSDICINPFEINDVTDLIFPGKIYQYLACRKPVIATRLKGLTGIFPDNGGKNSIYYFDLNKPQGFYDLLGKIKRTRVKDDNPSLQDIARIIEGKLTELDF